MNEVPFPTPPIAPLVARCLAALGVSLCLVMPWPVQAQGNATEPSLSQQRTVGGILKLLAQTKPDPERVEAYRAVLTKPLPPADAYWFTRRDALLERMDAAESLGDIKTRLEAANAIMAIFRERKDRRREMEFGIPYAGILREAGQTAQAYAIEEEVARDPQAYPHWVMTHQWMRSQEFSDRGDVEGATPFFTAGMAEYSRVANYRAWPNMVGSQFYTQAKYRRAQGRYAEAEASYQLAMRESDRWVASISLIAKSGSHALPSTRAYSAYLGHRLGYVNFLSDQGRLLDAQQVALQPLLWALERQGKYSPHAVRAAASYAEVLVGLGRHVEAEQIAMASIEMAQGIGAADDSLFMRAARLALARALLAQQRVPEADALFLRLQTSTDANWSLTAAFAAVLNGRAAQALAGAARSAELLERNLGASNPLTGEARGLHAMAMAATALQSGDRASLQAALALFRAAFPALMAARLQVGEAEDALRILQRQWILQAYLQALGQVAASDPEAMAESFRIADLLRGSSTQQAMAASAARASVGDPLLAAAARKEQDLRAEMLALYRTLQLIAGSTAEELKQRGINPDQLRTRADTLAREHNQLFADIERRFPKYANLVNPQPPSVAQLQAALQPGEALLSIFSGPHSSYVWAITPRGVAFHVSPLGEVQIAPLVKRLRSALDVGDLAFSRWPDIDLSATHRLYAELMAPVQSALAGADTLIVASSGSLASLPPALLTTAPHTLGADKALPFDRYLDAPWLDKRFAIVQVPSVNALVSLRSAPAGNLQRSAFMGFGDPLFASRPAGAAATPGLLRAAIERPNEASLRSATTSQWTLYSHLTPLPDTRDEILAMAQVLRADPAKDVVLGAQATRDRVKQSDLSRTRVIAFATHGLLPGDFPGLNQPALALAASPGKSADEQPLEALLTLEDVLQLKLDADWVVLSACNTAAADGQGSEAVSGLGRGFFYAGARAMLVTHWAVETESAKDLVTRTFSQYAGTGNMTRAKALQTAMHAVRNGSATQAGRPTYAWAHPLFWAPYALVGEPGR